MWAKIPAATASIACAACIAAASVAIPAMQSSEGLAKTISSEVNLSAINFGALDWLSAIPAYQEYLTTFNLEAFRVTDDHPGLDLLSALPLYEDLFSDDPAVRDAALADLDLVSGVPALLSGDLGSLDSVSAVPTYLTLLSGEGTVDDVKGLESVNATYAFNEFINSGGDFEAFVPTENPDGSVDNPGYAALSGVSSWQKFFSSGDPGDLGGIDAFSAIPEYQTLASSDATVGERADALRNLDAVSAIPEYLGLPTAEEEADAAPLAAKVAAPEETATTEEEPQTTTPLKQLSQTITQSLPQANIEAPAAPEVKTPELPKLSAPTITKKETASTEEKETSKGGGSYSGSFKPEPIVLFGSGKGNGADNGIRGWGEGLKKLGIGGGDTESAGGESGGEGAE